MKINHSGLGKIFAALFGSGAKVPAKDWGAKFGYAPANVWELAEWNASVSTRQVRRHWLSTSRRLVARREARALRIAGYFGGTR